MGFFNFFKRQKPNPKAKPYPARTIGYTGHASKAITGKDTTSFATIDRIASEIAMLSYGIYNSKTKRKSLQTPTTKRIKKT